jgi:hypothetical protein
LAGFLASRCHWRCRNLEPIISNCRLGIVVAGARRVGAEREPGAAAAYYLNALKSDPKSAQERSEDLLSRTRGLKLRINSQSIMRCKNPKPLMSRMDH